MIIKNGEEITIKVHKDRKYIAIFSTFEKHGPLVYLKVKEAQELIEVLQEAIKELEK